MGKHETMSVKNYPIRAFVSWQKTFKLHQSSNLQRSNVNYSNNFSCKWTLIYVERKKQNKWRSVLFSSLSFWGGKMVDPHLGLIHGCCQLWYLGYRENWGPAGSSWTETLTPRRRTCLTQLFNFYSDVAAKK
jgi:hypothetical protein